MSHALQRRHGTTAQHQNFVGLNAELTVDTTKKTVVVHDGSTRGGHPLATMSDLLALAGAEAGLSKRIFTKRISGDYRIEEADLGYLLIADSFGFINIGFSTTSNVGFTVSIFNASEHSIPIRLNSTSYSLQGVPNGRVWLGPREDCTIVSEGNGEFFALGLASDNPIPEMIQNDQLGAPSNGGYFGGYIKDNGLIHAIIVAPKATGQSSNLLAFSNLATPVLSRSFTGSKANTLALPNSDAADYCKALNINGFDDWALPARDVLEVLYRNLKPNDDLNNIESRYTNGLVPAATNFDGSIADTRPDDTNGVNRHTVPASLGYASSWPTMTPLELFQSSGEQAFDVDTPYLSSSSFNASNVWVQNFTDGTQSGESRSNQYHVRAVRMVRVR